MKLGRDEFGMEGVPETLDSFPLLFLVLAIHSTFHLVYHMKMETRTTYRFLLRYATWLPRRMGGKGTELGKVVLSCFYFLAWNSVDVFLHDSYYSLRDAYILNCSKRGRSWSVS